MTSDEAALLHLLEEMVPVEAVSDKREQVYTLPVVVWMMVFQRLKEGASQRQAVSRVVAGEPARLLSGCKRVREKRISAGTSAYSQACERAPLASLEAITGTVLRELRQHVEPVPEVEREVSVLDGSTLTTEHVPELLAAYPPARNQHGEAHWGLVHVLVLHDLRTGIPYRPVWGAMYGPEAVGEYQLAERAMDQLKAGTIVMGDGNFGIFAAAYAAKQERRIDVVWRLTKQRANAMGGKDLRPGADIEFCWRPSRKDRAKHPELPAEAAVHGRLLAFAVNGFREPLYIFTTLDSAAEQIARLYAKRWGIETDLRSFKQGLRLHHLRSRSKAMVEKEMLAAVIAYGLVRAMMALAARSAGLAPRELSFTGCYALLDAMANRLCAPASEERQQGFERILRYMAKEKLPRRTKVRSFPREVWGFNQTFPNRRPLIK